MTTEYKTIYVETCGNGSVLCFDREYFLLGQITWNAQRNQFEYSAQYATVYTTERLVEIASCLIHLQREKNAKLPIGDVAGN